MSNVGNFPLPFESLTTIRGEKEGSFIIGAMFTPGYAEKANRFAASCEKFGLPYVMCEVPAVHCSITRNGTPNSSYTKANFIHHLLSSHGKPVLYVDADCEFTDYPDMIDALTDHRIDFAVYNWLADEYTDAFAPVNIAISNAPAIGNRFYIFSHNVKHFATNQLISSVPVLFFGNSDAARLLLAEWHNTIVTYPGCVDDECLDFTFNNLGPRVTSIRTRWLTKAYARYSWWIYAKPVINHPDWPNHENNWDSIKDPAGRKRFYPERAEKRDEVRLFPRDCIIDTQQRLVCRIVNDQLAVVSPTDQNFWL